MNPILQPQKMLQHKYNHKSCIKPCMFWYYSCKYISSYFELPKNEKKKKKQLIIFSRLTLLKEDPQVFINVCPTNKTSIKINNEALRIK